MVTYAFPSSTNPFEISTAQCCGQFKLCGVWSVIYKTIRSIDHSVFLDGLYLQPLKRRSSFVQAIRFVNPK